MMIRLTNTGGESGLTPPNLLLNVDSGLVKLPGITGYPEMNAYQIDTDSKTQRNGRSGRIGPGCVIHFSTTKNGKEVMAHKRIPIVQLNAAFSAMCGHRFWTAPYLFSKHDFRVVGGVPRPNWWRTIPNHKL